jgi:hypothetical protein
MKMSKKIIVEVLIFMVALCVYAQQDDSYSKKNAITIGILQGGGGLVGFDYEKLIIDNIGIQIGAGLISVEGGLTIHFQNTTKSDAIWIGAWNQGIPGDTNSICYTGVSYIFRTRKWFTAQLGFAYIPYIGDKAKDTLGSSFNSEKTKFALLYSIGWYKGF